MPLPKCLLTLLASVILGGTVPAEDGPGPLVFVQRLERKLIMELKSTENPPFQVTCAYEDGKRNSYFVELRHSFSRGERYVVSKFEKKTSAAGADVSEMVVKDILTKKDFKLVYRVPQDVGGIEAQFRLKSGQGETFNVSKGDSFTLPHQSEPTYRLVEVQPESATVVRLDKGGKTGTVMVIQK